MIDTFLTFLAILMGYVKKETSIQYRGICHEVIKILPVMFGLFVIVRFGRL